MRKKGKDLFGLEFVVRRASIKKTNKHNLAKNRDSSHGFSVGKINYRVSKHINRLFCTRSHIRKRQRITWKRPSLSIALSIISNWNDWRSWQQKSWRTRSTWPKLTLLYHLLKTSHIMFEPVTAKTLFGNPGQPLLPGCYLQPIASKCATHGYCNHLRLIRTTAVVLSVQSDHIFGQEKVRKLLSNS